MFLQIDNWLFDKVFQPAADWFCDLTARNPFWLAATSMYLYIAGTITDQILFKHSWISMSFSAFLCVLLGFLAFSYDRKSIAPDKVSRTMNPNRVSVFLRILRVYSVISLPLKMADMFVEHPGQGTTHYDGLNLFMSVMFLLFLYFEACETKPPAPPKKKEVEGTRLAHSTS